jgi:mono/diheme cytochrome c family protein
MIRVALVVAAVALAGSAAAFALSAPRTLSPEEARALGEPGDAAAGRIVFDIGGCESCHATPGAKDPTRLGGGLELKTPFGSFFPPNISPDLQDGIGRWSVVDFGDALLAGVSPRGTHYFPAFPYPSYSHMTLKDVRDLYAFLHTLPPVGGRPPDHQLKFPFSIRRAVGLWKRLYLPDAPDPVADSAIPSTAAPSEALGRYLVEGPGHCAECHSPRDFLGGIVASRRLTGGRLPDGKGKAPDITAKGLADWSESDIAEALSSGLIPSGDSLGGAMAAVVRNLAELPPAYRESIARYLKSVKPGAAS